MCDAYSWLVDVAAMGLLCCDLLLCLPGWELREASTGLTHLLMPVLVRVWSRWVGLVTTQLLDINEVESDVLLLIWTVT